MALNITKVFLDQSLIGLKDNLFNLTEEEQSELCNELVRLCSKYAPKVFKEA